MQRADTHRVFTSGRWLIGIFLGAVLGVIQLSAAEDDLVFQVGAARIDITPDHPVRLNGYLARKNLPEASRADTPLFVRAVAITDQHGKTVVLVTIDTCAIPEWFRREVEQRVASVHRVAPDELAMACTHTHYAPVLKGAIPFIFGSDIPPEDRAHIDAYTQRVLVACVDAVGEALRARRPARLHREVGSVGFAANRRTPGGPVDHSLPVLWASDASTGAPLAVLATYACHATTIPPADNAFHGDWPGVAAMEIDRKFPGCVGLVTIGCGADANPTPRGSRELAERYGQQVAAEVERLVAMEGTPVRGPLRSRMVWIDLPFDKIPDKAVWEERARSPHEPTAYHARHFLRLLEEGKEIPRSVSYPIQTWCFDRDLAIVFLGGEVVVDYALRLRTECDADRLWVHGYCNSVPCYIASRRILREGGYEAETSMLYYAQPTRLSEEVEDLIIDTVLSLIPHDFYSENGQAEYPPSLSPDESRRAFVAPEGLHVQLVASEPLVVDPVWIDFGADGRLWVVEYRDYPTGLPDNYRPGGRIKWLEDLDGDGRYDEAHVFADRVPFPTGLMEWGDGVLVAAAPDVIWFRDRDRNGVADERVVLFTGFYTENYQARVNGFFLGLDGWIYGSCGLFGGLIGKPGQRDRVALQQQDFRFRIKPLVIGPAGGRSQYGRVRDDDGTWFGNTNSQLLLTYPLPPRFFQRQRLPLSVPSSVYVPDDEYDSALLYPVSRTLTRFNNPEHHNRVTSACGPCIYRDNLLGEAYYGNAFICEPVHNLVTRLVLRRDGVVIRGRRAAGEEHREFLASRDNWCRPVQVTTGPDGGLWLVDMYRFVIEHPRWISPRRLRRLDVRAGEEMGRIYRVLPASTPPRPVHDLTRLEPAELAHLMDSPNGTVRDLVQRAFQTTHTITPDAKRVLESLAVDAEHPPVRVQSLCTLGVSGQLSPELLHRATADPAASVRAWAVFWSEALLDKAPALIERILALRSDEDPTVRMQVALALGAAEHPHVPEALADLAVRDGGDAYLAAAILSSIDRHWRAMAGHFLTGEFAPEPFWSAFWRTVGERCTAQEAQELLASLARTIESDGKVSARYLRAAASLLSGIRNDLIRQKSGHFPIQQGAFRQLITAATAVLAADGSADRDRLAAAQALAYVVASGIEPPALLTRWLTTQTPAHVQQAVLESIFQVMPEQAPHLALEAWPALPTAVRHWAVDRILEAPEGARHLLESVRAGRLSASDLTPSQRNRLLYDEKRDIAAKARELLYAAAGNSQALVAERIRAVESLSGNATRGRALFEKHCATCHEAKSQEISVGPDLRELTDRSTAYLLQAILAPNETVDERYLSYAAVTRRGQIYTGVILEETPSSITLGLPDGTRITLDREELETVRSTGRSLMPDGFEQELSDQDLADLVAYLQLGLTPTVAATSNTDGSLVLNPKNGILTGSAARIAHYRGTLTLGEWQHESGAVRWRLLVQCAGEYEVLADWLNESDVAGDFLLVFRSDGGETVIRWRAEPTEVSGEGNWFRTERITCVHLPKGPVTVELAPTGTPPIAKVFLRSLVLRPMKPQHAVNTSE